MGICPGRKFLKEAVVSMLLQRAYLYLPDILRDVNTFRSLNHRSLKRSWMLDSALGAHGSLSVEGRARRFKRVVLIGRIFVSSDRTATATESSTVWITRPFTNSAGTGAAHRWTGSTRASSTRARSPSKSCRGRPARRMRR